MRERFQDFILLLKTLRKNHPEILLRAGLVLLVYVPGYLGFRWLLPEGARPYVRPIFYPLVALFGPEEIRTDEAGRFKVRVITLKEGSLTPAIVSTGAIEPLDKVEIFAKTQGRIERFFVDQGQAVKAGDLMVQMERLPLELQLAEQQSRYSAALAAYNLAAVQYQNARRDVEGRWKQIQRQETAARRAKAELDRIRLTYRGQTVLYRAGGLSPEQIRQGRTELIAREAEYRQALKDLEIARIGFRDSDIEKRGVAVPADPNLKYTLLTDMNTETEKSQAAVARAQGEAERSAMANTSRLLGETNIRAPIDGVVAVRNKSAGEEISGIGSATSSAALLTIVNISSVYAVTSAREGDSRKVKPGQKMRFTVDVFPDTQYEAEVKLISPVVDPGTHTITVKSILENPDGALKPGMFLRGEIITGEDRKAVLVPTLALQSLEEGQARAWILRKDRVFPVEVKTGERRGQEVEITEGLKAGDVIAVEKLSLLREAMQVAPLLNEQANQPGPPEEEQ